MTKIETVKISTLTPNPRNARSHNERNLNAIKDSLVRFGQQRPLVVDDDNVIIAGNGTWTAAVALGWEKIDIIRTKLSPEEAEAFGIIDNRANELSDWDTEALMATIRHLEDQSSDLMDICGFDAMEINDMMIPFAEPEVTPQDSRSKHMTMSKKSPTVRIVLRVCDVAQVERALKATGNPNRAEALMEVCESYVAKKG